MIKQITAQTVNIGGWLPLAYTTRGRRETATDSLGLASGASGDGLSLKGLKCRFSVFQYRLGPFKGIFLGH